MDENGQKEEKRLTKSSDVVEMGDVQKPSNGTVNAHNGQIIHEDLDYKPDGKLEIVFDRIGTSVNVFVNEHKTLIRTVSIFIFNGLVIGYFFGCLYYYLTYNRTTLVLCEGFGSLIAFLGIIYFFLIYFHVVKRFFGSWFEQTLWRPVTSGFEKLSRFVWFRYLLTLSTLAAVLIFLIIDTHGSSARLISLFGLFVLMLLGFIFSKHPGRIKWRSVMMGLLVQFLFGLVFIRWSPGRFALQCFSDKVVVFLNYGVQGANFVFGDFLVTDQKVFAFSTLPVIFFFSMLVEVLFFWGALQWFCLKLGGLLRAVTSTTVCESVIAVANVFLGMTESVLIIKPYMALLTPSEIHVVMASGFATVSGTILATYISFGADAAHLVTASVMSAPAAICYSKLLMPETKRSLTSVDTIKPLESQDQSALSAATRGATNGIALVLNIIANLVAFVSFIAFVNGVLAYGGDLVGIKDLNMETILGKIFIPLCWIMGVPWAECQDVGSLIGLKTMVNEFVAYQRMGEMKAAGLLSPRAELIATYSLCGFSNPASVGIMIGALAAMAPNQRETLSSLAVRAFCAGCGICFMTACIAGLLMPEDQFA